jgi:Peptidase inhibitor family I36
MRVRATIIGAITAAAMATIGFTAPAMAATHHAPVAHPGISRGWPYGCPSTATCSYDETNFGGTAGWVKGDNQNDKQYHTWADAESILNNGTQCTDWIYYNENYGKPFFEIPIGYQVSNLSGTWGWHHLYSNHWCSAG